MKTYLRGIAIGLGDEILALGRAEAIFEKTGQPVAITRTGGYARVHDAWRNNPAWNHHYKDGQIVQGGNQIIDGGGARPYIKRWHGRRCEYNLDYRARAGHIYLDYADQYFGKAVLEKVGPFAVVAPHIKNTASVNKDLGLQKWQDVIRDFPLPVLQLLSDKKERLINGAIGLRTPSFRQAAAVIARAQVVMCNEGGTHHMAASMGRPAVVIFGSFCPPCVTGYDFHTNIAVHNEHGFCGNFDACKTCQTALAQITPDVVRSAVDKVLAGDSNG